MKAAATFHAFDPDTARVVVFKEGDDVPDAVAETVGDHVLDGKAPEPDGDPQGDGEEFDPSAHNADKVREYLESLDREDEDQAAEYERVFTAELDGKNRTSALPDDPDA